jgi:hypothetical protein
MKYIYLHAVEPSTASEVQSSLSEPSETWPRVAQTILKRGQNGSDTLTLEKLSTPSNASPA